MVFGLDPLNEVFLISLLLSFALAVIYRFLVNQDKMNSLKGQIKEYQGKIKEAQKKEDTDEQKKYMGEMMKLNSQMMRSTMKPMLASLVIVGLSLHWIATTYTDVAAQLPFAILFIGTTANWFWIYILVTIPFVYIFRKLLGVV